MSNVNIQQYFDSLKPAGFAMGSVLVRYEIFQHEQITQMLLSHQSRLNSLLTWTSHRG